MPTQVFYMGSKDTCCPNLHYKLIKTQSAQCAVSVNKAVGRQALFGLLFVVMMAVCVLLQEANLQLQCERWRHLQWRFLNCKLEDAMVAAKPKVRTQGPCSRGGVPRGGWWGSQSGRMNPAVWKGGVQNRGQGHGLFLGWSVAQLGCMWCKIMEV